MERIYNTTPLPYGGFLPVWFVVSDGTITAYATKREALYGMLPDDTLHLAIAMLGKYESHSLWIHRFNCGEYDLPAKHIVISKGE